MNRYFKASILTLFIYSSLIASVVYMINNAEVNSHSKSVVETRTIAISMVQQKCYEKKIEKKKIEKVLKKETPKPKPKPKIEPKKIVKKEIVTPKVIEEIAVKEEVAEKVVEELEEEIVEEVTANEPTSEEIEAENLKHQQMQEMLIAKQQELDRFTLLLVQKINENKRYPLSARRRGIEGDVDVKFTVMSNGGVDNIIVLAGKSIFKKSTVRAIENSFPLDVEKSLLDFPKEFKIKLVYVLN